VRNARHRPENIEARPIFPRHTLARGFPSGGCTLCCRKNGSRLPRPWGKCKSRFCKNIVFLHPKQNHLPTRIRQSGG
jgi:hypothetical protein